MSLATPPTLEPQTATDGDEAEGRRRVAPRRSVRTILGPPLCVLALVLVLWYAVSYLLLTPQRRFLLPPAQSVIAGGFLTWSNFGQILTSLGFTARTAALGFFLATIIGMSLAVVMSQAKWVERALYPYTVFLQTVPILAVVPLIGFAFGFNFGSRVLVCVLIALFPIITNTLFGLLSVDDGLHDLFTLQGVSRRRRLWSLQLPAALPNIFTGLRISAGLSVIGAVVGDFFFQQGQPGLGELINLYRAQLGPDPLYAAVIMASLLGIVAFVLVGFISQRVIGAWHESARVTDRQKSITKKKEK
jgi:NitT/TauT family transport system permease protein